MINKMKQILCLNEAKANQTGQYRPRVSPRPKDGAGQPPINVMDEQNQRTGFLQILNEIMKRVLTLGQSSLSKHQYEAFRKLTMDYFAEGKRQLGKGWSGEKLNDNEGGGVMGD